eukprot:365511-Chlamydomonas_euryale.AAC.3
MCKLSLALLDLRPVALHCLHGPRWVRDALYARQGLGPAGAFADVCFALSGSGGRHLARVCTNAGSTAHALGRGVLPSSPLARVAMAICLGHVQERGMTRSVCRARHVGMITRLATKTAPVSHGASIGLFIHCQTHSSGLR